MNIQVWSRAKMNFLIDRKIALPFHKNEPYVIVSICGVYDAVYGLDSLSATGILELKFADMTREYWEKHQSTLHPDSMFNETHAIKLLDFIYKNKDVENWIIHCDAGLSRSGAVASWIANHFGISFQELQDQQDHKIYPNSIVLDVMNEVSGKTKDAQKLYDDLFNNSQSRRGIKYD